MKVSRSVFGAVASGILLIVLAAPLASFAREEACHPGEHMRIAMEDRGQWVKNQMAREAAWLEIKASQEGAWEAFAAANLELSNAFGNRKPLPPDVDAATAIRQHAEHAAAFAQSLSKLAAATEKLQAVLNEDQRKVLDRIVSLHSQFRGGHFSGGMEDHEYCQHGSEMSPHASRPSPKAAAPVKPKK